MDVSCEDRCAEGCMEGQVSRGKGDKKETLLCSECLLAFAKRDSFEMCRFEIVMGSPVV